MSIVTHGKSLRSILALAVLLAWSAPTAGGVVGHWTFDDADLGATTGAPLPDSDEMTVWRRAATDHSGNGNHLTTWEFPGSGFRWVDDSYTEDLAIRAAGADPAAMTWAEKSSPSDINLDTITPAAFTVEVLFQADVTNAYRTIVGRDGLNVSDENADKAPLYLSQRPEGAVAIEFTDVDGFTHSVASVAGAVAAGEWYHLAGVSNGSSLRLYLNGLLLDEVDVAASDSTDTRLSNGRGEGAADGTNWVAGSWSMARGLFAGSHADRFLGAIDEVAISDNALNPETFVVPVPEAVGTDVALSVDTDSPTHQINPFVYGHFLEHIYHSVNGGLWGELVWNRSFEMVGSGTGTWSLEDDELVQSSFATDVHLHFGDADWEDYEITLEALKEDGSEGFLILFRVANQNNFYWLNLGGWGNTQNAIEKEVNGARTLVGTPLGGSISSGEWYDVRIRCEGNNFKCWVNGSLLIDATDMNNSYLSGGVGLGTWGTQARYRNILVTDLERTAILHSGPPALPEPEFNVDFWSLYGAGKAVVANDALNDDYSVEVTGDGREAGLQQGDYKFTPQLYSGSLWMKGSVPAGLSVELLDDETVIGKAILPAPTSTWEEYPFEITPTASTEDGALRLSLLGAGEVKIDQVSMMGQDSEETGGYRPDLLKAVEELRPPIIRWPGGCFASLYLWKDGIGPQHERRKYAAYMWNDQDTNSYGTDEFLQMCEEISSEPIIVINTGVLDSACGAAAQFKLPSDDDYLPYALDWMEYCNGDVNTTWGAKRAENGHPEPYNVTYWEIDNETWAAGSDAYIEKVKEFAPAMQAKAEELGVPIKLIAVGGNRFDMTWNQAVIDECANLIDYISVHNYENPATFDSGVTQYENLLIDLADYIAQSDNPDMEIYNSEWNAQTIDWRTGLYAGGILNAYERQGEKFTIGGPALFLRHLSADAWDNAFINFDHTGWFPAPNYVIMKLWYDHYAPNFLELQGDPGGCNIVATRSEDGKEVFLKAVNPTISTKNISVDLEGSFTPVNASMQLVAPGYLGARNSLEEPHSVSPESAEASVNGQTVTFVLPPYSAGVVSLNTTQATASAWLLK